MHLELKTIGTFRISAQGSPLALPTSRKTRALLAYLVLSGATHSRQSLCELLWDTPDDPLAALRWSLSKLRPIANAGDIERLCADRQSIWFEPSGISSDRDKLANAIANRDCDEEEADAIWRLCEGVLLEDCELPNQASYSAWLEGQRADLSRARIRLARRFALITSLAGQLREKWAERWLREAPFSREAARCAVETKHATAGKSHAAELARMLTERFRDAELEPPALLERAEQGTPIPAFVPPQQKIFFVETADGASIAWASVGDEDKPPLVKAANWLNHLELDWEAPIWSPLFHELSRHNRFIRYDERGCGLSDWGVDEISFDKFVEDLEQVVDAAGLDRFPLLGISQGAAVSIEYAARHPDRVSKLILFGTYDCGWRHVASAAEVREREAIMTLTASGWGSDNPAYRHVFSRTFMPNANPDELDWFDEFQRKTTSSRNAVRFLEAFSRIDVRHRLTEIQCPTLVVHSRGDLRIPFAIGRKIAAKIPGAQFAGIESNNHLLLGREKASQDFVSQVQNFLKS